jgi:hypothetical protein
LFEPARYQYPRVGDRTFLIHPDTYARAEADLKVLKGDPSRELSLEGFARSNRGLEVDLLPELPFDKMKG